MGNALLQYINLIQYGSALETGLEVELRRLFLCARSHYDTPRLSHLTLKSYMA